MTKGATEYDTGVPGTLWVQVTLPPTGVSISVTTGVPGAVTAQVIVPVDPTVSAEAGATEPSVDATRATPVIATAVNLARRPTTAPPHACPKCTASPPTRVTGADLLLC